MNRVDEHEKSVITRSNTKNYVCAVDGAHILC